MLRASIVYCGVLLRRVVQRDPERAAAGQGEVVPVARVLLGVELAEQAGTAEQAVQVRGLPGVAHDLAEVLVLEIEHEHVLVARHPGGRRGESKPADRRRDGEAQAAGRGAVVPDLRRVRAVVVGERGREVEHGARRAGPARQRAAPLPPRELRVAGVPGPADRADPPLAEGRARCGQEDHLQRGLADHGPAEPGRDVVPGPGRHAVPGGGPQRHLLGEHGRAPGTAGEQPGGVAGRLRA